MDALKLFVITILSGVYTYLEPVHNPMLVLAFVFCADILAGILTDLIVNKDRLQIKKFLYAVLFLAIYLSIIASTFTIGEKMGDKNEILLIIKTLTYVLIYFYVSNTLRNLCVLFPYNRPLTFIYYWLGLQIVKKIPDLQTFLNSKRNKENETDT